MIRHRVTVVVHMGFQKVVRVVDVGIPAGADLIQEMKEEVDGMVREVLKQDGSNAHQENMSWA